MVTMAPPPPIQRQNRPLPAKTPTSSSAAGVLVSCAGSLQSKCRVAVMTGRGRPRAVLTLTDEERATLERWSRRAKSAQALAMRCRIVLACADEQTKEEEAEQKTENQKTVGKWRSRFLTDRLDGLLDEDRPG